MPFINANGVRHYYRLQGSEGLPTAVLVHSLGADHSLWDAQAAALLPHFRVLRYDVRGHGASDSPAGDYTIEMLARDTLAILDALGIESCFYCGLSMGGMIGQWIAAHEPRRLTKAVLANTSPRFADPSIMAARRAMALEQGMSPIESLSIGRSFTPETLARNPPFVDSIRRVLLGTNAVGYAGCCAAISNMNLIPDLAAIRIPTTIIVGDRDISTPWEGQGDVLAREIPHAAVVRLPAAHLSNLERPQSFNAALLHFFIDPAPDGMARRRAVLGDAHVDRAMAATTGFTRAFQELITQYAWGAIWQRPALDDRTRRLLVFTALAALGRWEEFRAHVRVALDHGMEPCDIEETLLQSAIYAGVPAANTAFRIASEELHKTGEQS